MRTEVIGQLTSTLEAHAQETDGGVKFGLARDLQYLLGFPIQSQKPNQPEGVSPRFLAHRVIPIQSQGRNQPLGVSPRFLTCALGFLPCVPHNRVTNPMNDEPLAFFITWTVYGTFLQGDLRGWHKWKKGLQMPQPGLVEWHADRLKHPILLLNQEQRRCIEAEIQRLSDYRGWRLWASAARSNHVHVVVHAPGFAGSKVRDQLKANCTRVLRENWQDFVDRPVWSEGGDWQCVNDEDGLECVIQYVTEAQDRKGIEHS